MIFVSGPESKASISMDAFSVSISAMTSPSWMSSPTALYHLAMVPSCIVSPILGIRTVATFETPFRDLNLSFET